MKLYYSPASPFVRKVVVTAMACGIEGQITRVPTNPWTNPAELVHDNPRLQAIADGLMDAAIVRRMEATRPDEEARNVVMTRQAGLVTNALDQLEAGPLAQHMDIGTLTVACALGYLDFRYAHEPFRDGRPRLSAWYEQFAQRPEIMATVPG